MRKTNIVKAFIIIALVLLIIAYTPAVLWWTGKVSLPVFFTYMRTVIHVGLLVAWAMSVYYRIIHKQVRRYLISIGGLMIFWLLIKTLKYYFVYDVDSTRMLWYAYYIPLLLIPTMGVLVALSLGKPENYRLPKWTNYFFICAVILVLLVLTNDFHNLVFIFPKGETGSDKNAAFNIIFLVVMAWVNLVGTVAIILIILKCRIPKSRAVLWLPLVSLSLTILYGILYLIK
ncbi:MAG TPA: histidine kinase N-terminal 7TM domain-containing protein, partial [Clostridia bacterium]|nr:histidine kinase N-terminal 7TM domain-containing protein [Clostridia bacterium]